MRAIERHEREPERRPGVVAALQRRDEYADVRVELDCGQEQHELALERRQAEGPDELRHFGVAGGGRRRRGGFAVAMGLEQRAHVRDLGHERRALALRVRRLALLVERRHDVTSSDCAASNAGGSVERRTSRLSTPSTINRTL